MPPDILSSPILSLPVLNSLLASPNVPAVDRLPLLAAKIHLLASLPSPQPTDILDLLRTRLELASIHMGRGESVEAEREYSEIRARSQSLEKRWDRAAASGEEKGEGWTAEQRKEVGRRRREALKGLVEVDEALGREGRAKRWRDELERLGGADGGVS